MQSDFIELKKKEVEDTETTSEPTQESEKQLPPVPEEPFFHEIQLHDDITDDSIKQVFNTLMGIDKEIKPVVVYISTYGGAAYAAVQIAKILEEYPAPVIAFVVGRIYSAGTLITAACDYRVSIPMSTMLIHQPLLSIGFAEHETQIDMEWDFKKNYLIKEIYSQYSKYLGMTEKEVKKFMGPYDRFIGTKEAMSVGKYGLIDGVVVRRVDKATYLIRDKDGVEKEVNFKDVVKRTYVTEEVTETKAKK